MKIPKSKLSKNSLKEKAIVVTGAGSGIGRALSFKLAKHNADLILLSRDRIKLDSLQDEIKEKFHDNKSNKKKTIGILHIHNLISANIF